MSGASSDEIVQGEVPGEDPPPLARLTLRPEPERLVYAALYGIARPLMDDERDDHTLQTTAVVHEAWLRLRDHPVIKEGPGHAAFSCIAANVIRQILVDHARTRSRLKRGRGWRRVPIDLAAESRAAPDGSAVDVMDLDEALVELEARSIRQCRVIEMRFFAGMTTDQVAEALGISERTVTNDWNAGRAFLLTRLADRRDG
ncbi:MAG: sigma-70 family RNA polymerase sigma factor [Phycisphaerae bacterium]|nr:sigma-70 family RNA polymerase sigma factor [Phycisphaerae bacterium]